MRDFITNKEYMYWVFVGSVLLISYLLSWGIRRFLTYYIKKSSDKINEDPTNFVFLKNAVSLIIYTTALILIFLKTPGLSAMGKGLFTSAGILAATIGLASQKVFSNILSGLFILFFKPFSVKDTIELRSDHLKGVVEEITLRHTVIRDYEHRRIIIPNSTISDSILVNSSIVEEKIKKQIDIGISYDSDIDLAKQIIREEISAHPLLKDYRSASEKRKDVPVVQMRLVSLGEYAVTIRAYVWTHNNDEAWILQCDVLESIKKRFDQVGIEIPFPYRTIVMKDSIPKDESSYNIQ